MAEKKLRKRSGFEIFSYFKDSTLTRQLKSVQGSKLGMWVQFINRRYTKGCLFSQKWYIRPSQYNVLFPIALPLVKVGWSVGQKKKRMNT